MSPVGLETKDHCAVEGHQQFNSQLSSVVRQWPVENDGSVEAEESPLLEAII
jgi:hypothetical protein